MTAHEQLYQDATRRHLRQEEYAAWFPEDVTFHPRLLTAAGDNNRVEAEQPRSAAAIAERYVGGARCLRKAAHVRQHVHTLTRLGI